MDEDDTRFFGRLSAFDCECPYCGKLIQVGRGKPDNHRYNRVTSVVTCGMRRGEMPETAGCGRQFLIGIIAWPIKIGRPPSGRQAPRPPDQRPSAEQLAELRRTARAVWSTTLKRRGETTNRLEPEQEGSDGDRIDPIGGSPAGPNRSE